jgi:hypothetical protein
MYVYIAHTTKHRGGGAQLKFNFIYLRELLVNHIGWIFSAASAPKRAAIAALEKLSGETREY